MTELMGDDSKAYEPRYAQNTDVLEAFGSAIMTYGVKQMALKLRKSESQLYGEMNPSGDQKKAKLSVDDAIEATRITKNTVWLNMIVTELGCCLCHRDISPDKDTVSEELADDIKRLGKFAEVVMDPDSTPREIREASLDARREIRETEVLAIRDRQRKQRKIR